MGSSSTSVDSLLPLGKKSLADQAYDTLRRMIIHGQLPPNSKIVEDQLASALGISRTPVREALQRLTYDGLVVNCEKGGSCVAELTVEDIEEVYPLVQYLEGLAVVQAIQHLSDADLQRMEELTEHMAACGERGEVEALMIADNEFHSKLHSRSGNQRLEKIVRELRSQMERFEFLYFSSPQDVKSSLRRHRKLIGILRSKDTQEAREALMEQWDIGRQALVSLVSKLRDSEVTN